jgi:pimeloyl-ACP methyl ester carboxylesterase
LQEILHSEFHIPNSEFLQSEIPNPQSATPMTLPFVSSPRTDTPVLLLHGILGSFEAEMEPLAPYFEQDFYVAGVDFRLHGTAAAADAASITLDGLVDDVLEAMETLDLPSAHLCGYSLGGFVALALAHRAPQRVRSIVMHGTKFYWTEENASMFADEMRADTIGSKQPRWAARLAVQHGSEHWRRLCNAASDFVRGLPGVFTEAQAKEVAVPVQVGTGDRDELVPPEEALALYRALPAGALSVLPDTRHAFHLIDRTRFCNDAKTFILRADGR